MANKEAYPATAIANFFLKMGERDGKPLTPMQLQKLVYIAHGWSLAIEGKDLIREDVQAWQYGPVIEDLYHRAKRYGSSPVTSQLPEYEGFGNVEFIPTIDSKDTESQKVLKKVWDVYRKFDAIDLMAMTHREDTPWYEIWENQGGKHSKNAIIPDERIKQHYQELSQHRQDISESH